MGHPKEVDLDELNNVCPYFTMFPLAFPRGVLAQARKNETVLDPFCGRGTTLVAGRERGLTTIGIDRSEVAVAIAAAKVVKTKPHQVYSAVKLLLSSRSRPETPDGDFWQNAYHPETLRQICKVREGLQNGRQSPARIALRATMLGGLHGPLRRENPWYFSNQMPRTYASKPAYSTKYWRENKLVPTKVNVADIVKKRATKYFSASSHAASGTVLHDDSRLCNLRELDPQAKWIVTSPPYYGMRSYRPDQWLREWFLGGEPKVNYTSKGISHESPDAFAHDLGLVWSNMANYCQEGATMVVRFGGINDRPNDPRPIIKRSFKNASRSGWELVGSNDAGEPVRGRRQATQFSQELNSYVHERDYVLKLN